MVLELAFERCVHHMADLETSLAVQYLFSYMLTGAAPDELIAYMAIAAAPYAEALFWAW